jgi:hypothetical protein
MADRAAAPALGRGTRWWRATFLLLLVGAAASIPALALAGRDAIEQSRAGRLIGVVTDPTAPGYEVLVEPSPVLLLVQVDAEEHLQAVTFLALSSEETGSALFLPPAVTVERSGGPVTLQDAWSAGGLQELTDTVEDLLGVGIADFDETGRLLERGDPSVLRVDQSLWSQLTAPVAPIEVANPDTVEVFDDEGGLVARFAAGGLQLEADAVGVYLAARGSGESDLNRMLRHQVLWEAWIDAVRDDGTDDAVPGETDTGLGRYVRTFARGVAGFVPVRAGTFVVPGADDELYQVDEEWLSQLVAAMVPFPRSPQPGGRPVIDVLDGTGTAGASLRVAKDLARQGAEIRTVGNGPTFDYVETHILYYDAEQGAAAEAMREALGAGATELRENPDEVATVTVILGTDVVGGLDSA